MSDDKKSLSMLLVGGSGEGKSEFILSFINDEHRKKIPASGDGQTTRTSMVYTINRDKVPLKVEMTIKAKEVFCRDRVEGFMSKFNMKIIKDERLMRARKKGFIHDNAFFDVVEFTEENRKRIENKYDELFNSSFFESITIEETQKSDGAGICSDDRDTANKELNYGSDKQMICTVSQDWLRGLDINDESKSKYTLEDCLEYFSEWMYGICVNEISDYLKQNQILVDGKENAPIDISVLANEPDSIRTFIRTEKDKRSYSSLVETICVSTYIADYYKDLLDSLRISQCIFVDTYGLDHTKFPEDVLPKDILTKRYHRLFREYPEIDTVLYIRKARSNPPSDLDQNIPPLYMVKPSVMSYIVFTNVDRAGDSGKKTIADMKNPDSEVYSAIYEKLIESNVDSALSEMRIECIAKNIVEYCSKTGDVYNKDEYETYIHEHQDQVKQLRELFLSIRDKRHLGSQLINIDSISIDNISNILDVNKIFSGHEDFYDYGYPSRTMGALGDRLMNGVLGFHSSTWDDFKYWDDEIFNHVKKRFINISKELDWVEILGSENAVPVIQSLFNEFMDMSVRCSRDYTHNFTNYPVGEYCCGCNHKDGCLQSIIYEQKKRLISGKYYPVHRWLTNIYDFSTFDADAKAKIQQIFFNLYIDRFIPQCRQNNARILASGLYIEMTEQEIEEKIQEYFEHYDTGLDEDGRILFEQMVNQYI